MLIGVWNLVTRVAVSISSPGVAASAALEPVGPKDAVAPVVGRCDLTKSVGAVVFQWTRKEGRRPRLENTTAKVATSFLVAHRVTPGSPGRGKATTSGGVATGQPLI